MIAVLRKPRLTPHSTKSPGCLAAVEAAQSPMWTRQRQPRSPEASMPRA